MNQISREKRFKMAIDAFMKDQYPSKAACAKAHGISPSTFATRLGKAIHRKDPPKFHPKITEDEDNTLCEWMYDMCQRGLAFGSSDVRYMLNLILSARLKASSWKPTANDEWIKSFVDTHTALDIINKERHNDCQYSNCEEPGSINDWFRRVQHVVQKYNILEQDIYNMDVFGIQTEVGSIPKIIPGAEARYEQGKKGQSRNPDFVSLIIAINSKGSVLPPQFVLTGRMSLSHYNSENIPEDYRIWESTNGWADDTSKFRWIEMFDTLTAPQTAGKYRLLIVDGYRSHATASFDRFCTDRKIIPLYMPPYSTHLLQPLDTGCFVPLTCLFHQEMGERTEASSHAIEKKEILPIYAQIHEHAFKESNILSGFTDAGLIPLCPKKVLDIIDADKTEPLPPLSGDEDFDLETLRKEGIPELKQRQRQLHSSQKEYLSKIHEAVGDAKLFKLCESICKGGHYAMWSRIRLKREKERIIAFYKHLDGEDGEEEEEEEKLSARRTRRPARCGVCRNEGHNRSTCPTKQKD